MEQTFLGSEELRAQHQRGGRAEGTWGGAGLRWMGSQSLDLKAGSMMGKGGELEMHEPLDADGAEWAGVGFVGKVDSGLDGTLEKEKDASPIPRGAWSVFLTTWVKHRPRLGRCAASFQQGAV